MNPSTQISRGSYLEQFINQVVPAWLSPLINHSSHTLLRLSMNMNVGEYSCSYWFSLDEITRVFIRRDHDPSSLTAFFSPHLDRTSVSNINKYEILHLVPTSTSTPFLFFSFPFFFILIKMNLLLVRVFSRQVVLLPVHTQTRQAQLQAQDVDLWLLAFPSPPHWLQSPEYHLLPTKPDRKQLQSTHTWH